MRNSAFARDLEKYYRIECNSQRPRFRHKLRLWLNNFGLHCVACYRFGQWAQRLHSRHALLGMAPRLLAGMLSFLVRAIHHVELNVANIGPGLYIGHANGIFIGAQSIGDNLSLTHNVTVGQGHSEGKQGRPCIGHNVWIGTGAIVAGAIAVGDNVTIAPGTVLSRSVPEACLVGGNPGRVMANGYDNQKRLIPPPPIETRVPLPEPSAVAAAASVAAAAAVAVTTVEPVASEAHALAESK